MTNKFPFDKLCLVSGNETFSKAQNKEVAVLDKNKLLYFIKDRGHRIDDFLDAVRISKSAFYSKCKNNTFRVCDILKIAEFLNLTIEDIDSIFFANLVSQNET